MLDLLFAKLSSSFSIPQNVSLSFNFLVNSLVSDLMSNTFPFVVGQNFGPFVNNNIWNLVRWHFDNLMILGCIFYCKVLLVGYPSFFVFVSFSLSCLDITSLLSTVACHVCNTFLIFVDIIDYSGWK